MSGRPPIPYAGLPKGHDGVSSIFFQQLRMPTPDVDPAVGSTVHGAQTGRMLERIERVLLDVRLQEPCLR
jgi:hypothetical protein